MMIRTQSIVVIAVLAGIAASTTPASAQALSSKECGAKYQTAKAANGLNGMNYFDFRKAQCSAAAATPAAAAAPAAPAAQANPLRPTPTAVAPAKPVAPAVAAAPAATGNAVFPRAIDPKYSTLSAGRGRMKTCDDQYNANKANGGNGGMKWIEKGGGYWSACNKALKV